MDDLAEVEILMRALIGWTKFGVVALVFIALTLVKMDWANWMKQRGARRETRGDWYPLPTTEPPPVPPAPPPAAPQYRHEGRLPRVFNVR